MQLKLAENIKKYRKEMELTQEGLAEAIGVTVGAVSKWENGNNVPDVLTMMELANFFNRSVDELIGYHMTSKKMEDMCTSIENLYQHHKYEEAIMEANNALIRYPHSFRVLYTCAGLYSFKIYESDTPKEDAKKAIELYESALTVISQNEDTGITDYAIKLKIAKLHTEINPERSLELLKRLNHENSLATPIAQALRDAGKTDDALQYFTVALMRNVGDQIEIIHDTTELLIASGKRSNIIKALELLDMGIDMIRMCFYDDHINYMDKFKAFYMAMKALGYASLEEDDSMKQCLGDAYHLAKRVDEETEYGDLAKSMRFCFMKDKIEAHDNLSAGAIEGLETMFKKRQKQAKGVELKALKKVMEAWEDYCYEQKYIDY